MSTFTITSLPFFAFLLVAALVYYAVPKLWQWGWLLFVSIAFLILATGVVPLIFVLVNAGAAYGAARVFAASGRLRIRRLTLLAALFIIAGQLFMLKYYHNLAAWILPKLGIVTPAPMIGWLAPVGISYFSLSTVSYLLDVYWEKQQAERNPLRLLLYVAYFPALVSGPVMNYPTQSKALFAPHPFNYVEAKHGIERLLWGLFKKMVLADRIALITGPMFSAANTTQWRGLSLAAGVLLYAYQIYADFSGCMDIVLGVSQIFQIFMPENFQRPFLSQNLSEFWRRWHITLGEWSKEYILYPLLKSALFVRFGSALRRRVGKKAGKTVPTYVGLLILWLIIGIWHGGTARYILAAGILPWFLLVSGQILQPVFNAIARFFRVNRDCFSYRLFSAMRTLMLMCVIWLFALSSSIGDGLRNFTLLFSSLSDQGMLFRAFLALGKGTANFAILGVGLVMLIGVSAMQEKGIHIREALDRQNLPFRWMVLLGLIAVIAIFGIYGPGYNPADFIYGGF